MGVKSPVWLFYENTDGSKFKCKICGHKMKYLGGSTSNMRHHILSVHRETSEAEFLIYRNTKQVITLKNKIDMKLGKVTNKPNNEHIEDNEDITMAMPGEIDKNISKDCTH